MELSDATPLKLIIFGIIGIILFCFMMYHIILNASSKIWKESQKQTKLLEEMARKSGVDESKISTAIKE